MRARIVAAMLAAGLPFLVGGAVLLSRDEPRLAATNSVPLAGYVAVLEPGQRLCQPHQQVPAGAAGARLFAGVYGRPGPPLTLTVSDARGPVARGAAPGGYGDRLFTIPLRGPRRAADAATACVRNRGTVRLALAGRGEPVSGTTLDGRPLEGRVHVSWLRPGRESWLELSDTIAARAGVAKAGFMGSWTLWAALALVAAAGAGAAATLLAARPR